MKLMIRQIENILGLARTITFNTGSAKVEAQCSADTLILNQPLVLRINISGKIATFANP